jgi:phosphatidylinositol 3-kinase
VRDGAAGLAVLALTLSRAAVDFGYILGRDPKPFPPALKLSREMVEAMGGAQSPHYARFKSLCYTAYTSLRKNSNLILNLVALMVDANIPDIRIEPDKAVLKVSPCCALSRQREMLCERC